MAAAPTPVEVAIEVPEEIYTIPPSSPVYTPRLSGSTLRMRTRWRRATRQVTPTFEDDGTTVYGTGYDYEDWARRRLLLRLGLDVWLRLLLRPVVSMVGLRAVDGELGGLRAALIENHLRSLAGPVWRHAA